MLAHVFAPAILGLDNRLVTIECDVTAGLPGITMVGLGDKAVDESRERVRSALKNSGLILPPKRLTLNLAPANLRKDGTGYDLGIAIAILVATGQLTEQPSDSLFFGELALNGELRAIRGALLAAQLAAEAGKRFLYVPAINAPEAALVEGVHVVGVTTLRELFHHLSGHAPLARTAPPSLDLMTAESPVDLSDIYGQTQPKRALEIAAAGGHNVLLSGPPGVGKTMLAKAFVGLLPAPSFAEMLEITRIAGLASSGPGGIITARPFRAPHHSASNVALIGGGRRPHPGEVSLSHRGVLFLDELPEFPRQTLEMLRQPLEEQTVSISRATDNICFPADFILIATANPCPCGYYGDSLHTCSCSLAQVNRYRHRLSGPLIDRIDLIIDVGRVDETELRRSSIDETSLAVRQRVSEARERQAARQNDEERPVLNARLKGGALSGRLRLSKPGEEFAHQAARSLGLSTRAYTRTLKVARTIADLEGSAGIEGAHVAEALQYRGRI